MNLNHYNPTKLVEWREKSGKTQEQIAEIIGIERNTVSRAEKGKVASYELLASLCRVYEKSTHELIYSQPIAAFA